MLLKVRCPNCNRVMLYVPRSRDYNKWYKTCVYCGKRFKVVLKNKEIWERIIKITK